MKEHEIQVRTENLHVVSIEGHIELRTYDNRLLLTVAQATQLFLVLKEILPHANAEASRLAQSSQTIPA